MGYNWHKCIYIIKLMIWTRWVEKKTIHTILLQIIGLISRLRTKWLPKVFFLYIFSWFQQESWKGPPKVAINPFGNEPATISAPCKLLPKTSTKNSDKISRSKLGKSLIHQPLDNLNEMWKYVNINLVVKTYRMEKFCIWFFKVHW